MGGRPGPGGLLLAESMRPWTLPVALALAVAGLALCAGISIPSPVEKAPDAVAGMLRAVLRCQPALRALGVAGLLNLVATVTGVVLLPLSTESWGAATPVRPGDGLPRLRRAGAPLLSRLVTITRTGGLLVLAGAVLVVALSPVPWPALPLLALAGAMAVVIESLLTGTLQNAVPDRYRAGALGLADTIMVAACLVGSLLAPALARVAGLDPHCWPSRRSRCCRCSWSGWSHRSRRPLPTMLRMSERQRDPIREAHRQWVRHGWGDAADGMVMVTSLVRVQQLLMERIDAVLRPLELTFARYEVLRLLSFSSAGAMPMTRLGSLLQVHPTSVTSAVDRLSGRASSSASVTTTTAGWCWPRSPTPAARSSRRPPTVSTARCSRSPASAPRSSPSSPGCSAYSARTPETPSTERGCGITRLPG